jgi:6-phosphofructokinase 1
MGILRADYVDLTALPDATLATLERTPSSALGSSRYRPSDAELENSVADLQRRGVVAVTMIGGNDTADTLHRLHLASLNAGTALACVGIPKTIDNDLPGMDHCPGYGSAARYVALAARAAALDTAAMRETDPIKILEVMGRNAGWLAAAAALGREAPTDGPQVIFLPERPRPVRQMLDDVRAAYQAAGWAVVVISENQRDEMDKPLAGGMPIYTDPYGHAYHESPGAHLARLIQTDLGLRARFERPGSLARTSQSAISSLDLAEARQAGVEAARRALGGQSDVMVAIQRADSPEYAVSYVAEPLVDIAHQERRLPDAFIASSGIDVTDAFLAYARPLLGDPLPPVVRLLA